MRRTLTNSRSDQFENSRSLRSARTTSRRSPFRAQTIKSDRCRTLQVMSVPYRRKWSRAAAVPIRPRAPLDVHRWSHRTGWYPAIETRRVGILGHNRRIPPRWRSVRGCGRRSKTIWRGSAWRAAICTVRGTSGTGGLVATADDLQGAVAAFEAEILDIGAWRGTTTISQTKRRRSLVPRSIWMLQVTDPSSETVLRRLVWRPARAGLGAPHMDAVTAARHVDELNRALTQQVDRSETRRIGSGSCRCGGGCSPLRQVAVWTGGCHRPGSMPISVSNAS